MVSARQTLLESLLCELGAAITDARTPDENGRCQPAAVAALSKELRAVREELDGLLKVAEGSKADELAARRAVRRANSADSASGSRRSQSRRRGGSNRAG